MIDLQKYFLLLSDIVPNKTTFTNVDIAFALNPPPPQPTNTHFKMTYLVLFIIQHNSYFIAT